MIGVLFRIQAVWMWLVSFPIGWWAAATQRRADGRDR